MTLAIQQKSGIVELRKSAAFLGLTGKYAVAALLGITGGESQWTPAVESFNYKTADRLLEVFPSVFNGDRALAQQYVGNPNNALPEFLYGYKSAKGKGLGNTNPGDGAAFVGRGFIQLTGRANYERYSHLLCDNQCLKTPTSLIDNPNILTTPSISAQSAVLYLLDRVKVSQNDPRYFQAALNAVGYNTPDILAKKTALYEYFLQNITNSLQQDPNFLTTVSGPLVTDSSGTPIRTGQIN